MIAKEVSVCSLPVGLIQSISIPEFQEDIVLERSATYKANELEHETQTLTQLSPQHASSSILRYDQQVEKFPIDLCTIPENLDELPQVQTTDAIALDESVVEIVEEGNLLSQSSGNWLDNQQLKKGDSKRKLKQTTLFQSMKKKR